MRKKTRKRSYKNTIAIGIASFASIALLSTGLAAFVLIRDAQQSVDGNFVVAEVSDANIVLNITRTADPTLRLDAELGDNQGRVQIDSSNTVGAVLTYKVEGNVTLSENKTITKNLDLYYIVNIKLGGSVNNTEFTTAFIDNSGTNKYLSLVGGPLGNQNDITPILVDGHPNQATFTFDFGFAWGDFFNGVNPSHYFDSTDGLENYTDEQVASILTGLKDAEAYTFEIVIYAKNADRS